MQVLYTLDERLSGRIKNLFDDKKCLIFMTSDSAVEMGGDQGSVVEGLFEFKNSLNSAK